ncbi:MAG: hypothetical protein MAG431_02487 [Chloroflexi bacterium]|nr:hypothetical protein [Chloroflexota bacterium]
MDQDTRVIELVQELLDELYKAMGFTPGGWISKITSPLFEEPMFRFSTIATKFDTLALQEGFQEAAQWFITHFVNTVDIFGGEDIPREGPLLIAANHPGAYDSLVIAAHVPRDDIKIITSPITFLRKLPITREHMIFSAPNAHTRMGVVRKAIRHLREGGALLVFARGSIDPDPAYMPGAEEELELWSPSLGLFLRKVPRLQLAVTLISGVLSPQYFRHPFTNFRRERIDKQRIAEFFQVMHQLVSPGKIMVSPRLSFDSPLTLEDLDCGEDLREMTDEIVGRAKRLLPLHTQKALPA